jgi:hypothetical protein
VRAVTRFDLTGRIEAITCPTAITAAENHPLAGSAEAPAVRSVAETWPDEHGEIVGATPYS